MFQHFKDLHISDFASNNLKRDQFGKVYNNISIRQHLLWITRSPENFDSIQAFSIFNLTICSEAGNNFFGSNQAVASTIKSLN